MKTGTNFDLAAACPGLQIGEDRIYYSKLAEGKAEHSRDSAEPKGEINVWPREGTQEARVAAREIVEGSSLGARRAGASESTFRSVAEQCGEVESEGISYPEEGNEVCFHIEDQVVLVSASE